MHLKFVENVFSVWATLGQTSLLLKFVEKCRPASKWNIVRNGHVKIE